MILMTVKMKYQTNQPPPLAPIPAPAPIPQVDPTDGELATNNKKVNQPTAKQLAQIPACEQSEKRYFNNKKLHIAQKNTTSKIL